MNVSAMEDNGSSVLACNFDSSNDMLDTSHASNQNCSDPESSDIFHSSDVSQMNDSVNMNSEAQEDMFDDAQSTDFVYTVLLMGYQFFTLTQTICLINLMNSR